MDLEIDTGGDTTKGAVDTLTALPAVVRVNVNVPDRVTVPGTPEIDPATLAGPCAVIGSCPAGNVIVTPPLVGIDPPETVTVGTTPPTRTAHCVLVCPPTP
jgi:hypothetical protein